MFVGREKELAMLNRSYQSRENAMVVLYGREGMGKTALVRQFIQEKEAVYYQARELSEKEQSRYFKEKTEQVVQLAQSRRLVFIVDEFDLMQKGYKE